MKLCALKLKNINSFRGEVELDFEKPPLDDASLVAITGPTGSGKTTLLDAICVALYGKTPRLTGTGDHNPKHLISHGEKECFAEVHFIANETRYIANWSGKNNISPPKGSLRNANSDELITDKLSSRGKSLGSSEKTIDEEIKSILGLDFDGFKRSVLLAQGEFAAFLKAKDEERRTILEANAGIYIYDILKQILHNKVNEVTTLHDQKKIKFDSYSDYSPEQLNQRNIELNNLNEENKKLNEGLDKIQNEKDRETERNKQHEKLESSQERLNELRNEQPKIDKYKSELVNGERANQIRAEKQIYDTTKSDHQKSTDDLNSAKTKQQKAQKLVDTKQSVFTKKETLLSEFSTEHEEKSSIYTQAKSDVQRATEQFEEAKRRKPALKEHNTKIDTLTKELTGKVTEQKNLQKQITEAQTFLEQNPLPTDRDSREIKLTKLQANISSKSEQLAEKNTAHSEIDSKIDELQEKVEQITKEKEALQKEQETTENTRNQAEKKYNELQNNGNLDDWQKRKNTAIKGQLIIKDYENTCDQLAEENEKLINLQDRKTTLDESVENIEKQLVQLSNLCEQVDAKVEELEKDREYALLTDSVNHLRNQLEVGKPCRVCGSTDHPYAEKDDPERDVQVEIIEEQLKIAKREAKEAENNKRKQENKLLRNQESQSSGTSQYNECTEKIESLNDNKTNLLTNWQELFDSTEISSEWVEDRIEEADTAIDNLNTTRGAYNDANNALNQVTNKLSICERDYQHESISLSDAEKQLDDIQNDIEDLSALITSIETNFWDSIPEAFRTDTTEQALSNFSEMIEKVSSYEQSLNNNKHQLELIDADIDNNNKRLKGLKQEHIELKAEIEEHQNIGEEILNSVKEKTEGLETEDEINDAAQKLNDELKTKTDEQKKAHEQLLESKDLLTQKTTAHQLYEKQLKEDTEKLQKARNAYFEQLEKFGFNSPDEHTKAFRDETQMQELKNKIKTHDDEIQDMSDTIAELKTCFEEAPFEPEKLEKIITKEEEIEKKIQKTREDIGAQQKTIGDLNEKLEQRNTLEKELNVVKREMDRWKNLQQIIPQNKLRDFALDIVFQQVSSIANVQLAELTSDRYQLKVETIGKLSVIDKWNANQERPVETLSGGESFLTSLALALALSEISQGRSQLNSLFLDEGFGTLDAETLDIAIAALEGLRMQGRNIYLISHIRELTRRLPVKINVKKKGDGSSTIETKI